VSWQQAHIHHTAPGLFFVVAPRVVAVERAYRSTRIRVQLLRTRSIVFPHFPECDIPVFVCNEHVHHPVRVVKGEHARHCATFVGVAQDADAPISVKDCDVSVDEPAERAFP